MIITKKAIPRRAVLRGLGATVALPVLDSMVPALSALEKTGAAPVRRLGFTYVPNGVNGASWTPVGKVLGSVCPRLWRHSSPSVVTWLCCPSSARCRRTGTIQRLALRG